MAFESKKSQISSQAEKNRGVNFGPNTPSFIRKFQSNFRPLDLCKLSSALTLNQDNFERTQDQNSQADSHGEQKSNPSSSSSSLNSTPRIRHFASCYHQRGAQRESNLRRQCSQIRLRESLLSSLFSPRTKEIEFAVPQTLSPLTPTLGRKIGINSNESSPGSHSTSDHSRAPSPVFFRTQSGSEGVNLLGSINPELYKDIESNKSKKKESLDNYSDSEEEGETYNKKLQGYEFGETQLQQNYGRVWFSLEYNLDEERLVVTVAKAKNLFLKPKPQPSYRTMYPEFADSDGGPDTCNPCVRVSLLPDERRSQQSTVKLGTSNPTFGESFGFQISKFAIQERSVKICFFHVDARCNKYTLLGYVIQPLKEYDNAVLKRQDFKLDLVREVSDLSPSIGEILVSVCYNRDISRLTVTVVEARGIKSRDSTSGLYAKVQLSQNAKILKSKKTSTADFFGCRSNFNESFNFKIQEELLNSASISIQIMYSLSGYNKDQPAGRISLGSFMFARGKGLDHWNEMISKQKQQIQYWHPISE